MKLVATLIEEIKQDFEGGSSLACDWNIVIKRATQTVLENINPSTLKRNVPIYGGFLRDNFVYYCPDSVRAPVALETNDKLRRFIFTPSSVFYKQRNAQTFTIESLNGYKFLVAYHQATDATTLLDDMDSVTTVGGTCNPEANELNYLSGTQSVEGTFTDTGNTINRELEDTIDLSEYSRGTILMPTYFKNAANIASISFQLFTDATNYYTVSSSVDSIGSSFIDGWNRIRFAMKNLQATLSPSLSTITKWQATITTETGETEVVIIDNITVHKSAQWYLEFYSDQPFIDGVSGAWKSTVDYNNADYINLSDDECALVHYEVGLILATNNTQRENFASQLKRKYNNYFADNPSDAEPLSYNISEEIDMSLDGSVNNIMPKIGDPIVTDTVTVIQIPNNATHDALTVLEIVSGTINDTNLVFGFAESPSALAINGVIYVEASGAYSLDATGLIATLTQPVGVSDGAGGFTGDIYGLR